MRRRKKTAASAGNRSSNKIKLPQTTADQLLEIGEIARPLKLKDVHCSVCNIYVTSITEFRMHEQGSQHRKKLVLQGVDPNKCSSVVENSESRTDDYSMFRTPSGAFYCHICNLTLSSEVVFKQHLAGKKHSKKESLQRK